MSLRRLLTATLLLCVSSIAIAGTPAPGTDAVRVGAAITTKKATEIDKLAKDPKKFVGKTVRIEGTVKKVCQGAGCWVEVASSKGVTFLAKSLDESVLLPKDCAGRQIMVQGVVTMLPAKEAEAHQHAEPVGEATSVRRRPSSSPRRARSWWRRRRSRSARRPAPLGRVSMEES
jgi:hypothetical protein